MWDGGGPGTTVGYHFGLGTTNNLNYPLIETILIEAVGGTHGRLPEEGSLKTTVLMVSACLRGTQETEALHLERNKQRLERNKVEVPLVPA